MPADRMASTPVAIVPFDGREIALQYEWINAGTRDAPLVVFLHEGLGSIEMWRDFPGELCAAGGYRGFVYSRYGYGRSTARPAGERWTPEYLERQARDVLPALLDAVGAADARPWLFGHSDGATIALIYAALFPDAVRGAIVMAPHVFLEDVARAGIRSDTRAIRVGWLQGAPRALSRGSGLRVLGLARCLDGSRVHGVEYRGHACADSLPDPGDSGRGRRVWVDGAARRDCAPRADC